MFRPRAFQVLVGFATLSLGVIAAAQELPPPNFERDIAPVFQQRCLSCHAEDASGGLRLTSKDSWGQGGDSGPAFVAGDGAGSLVLRLVAADDQAELKMPPEGPRLARDEVERLRRWINDGAAWPDDVVLKSPLAAAAHHWAFRPVSRPSPPSLSSRHSSDLPLDAFIQARLDERRLAASPPADPGTLMRRVTLDLTGLPPTAKELRRFLADQRPDAYEAAVDRLLASPAYGERWARQWLDLCHFADTDGFLTDQARPVAWRYRQWLIEALNADLPFDQFTLAQLAGDLLPANPPAPWLGTGFLRNTLSNREGGADLEEYRVEQIIDRARMVGTVWLGLTVGCARCHDHKFDPLKQREFYQLYAFLDQADEVNLDAPLAGEAAGFAASQVEYQRRRAELIAPVRAEVEALQARWEAKMLEAVAHPADEPLWYRQWEVLGLIWGGHLGEGQLEGCVIVQTPLALRTMDEVDRLLDYFLERGSLIDEKQFADSKLAPLATALTELRKTTTWPTRAPAMRQARQPRRVFVHQRGDFRSPGGEVAPSLPSWLPATKDAPRSEGQPNRLTLARWLVSPANPLTPRVVVNRMWREFFGQGLVEPPDDFGLRGATPSHPELLDWLSREFQARGWSMKAMHRLVVTSSAYRRSSLAREDLAAIDPQNRLLARQAPLRVSSDQVRDATLAAAGLLVTRVGGPSVFPPQPESVAKEGFSNVWKSSDGQDRYRRGLYTWTQRLSPFAQNVTFDAPPTSLICSRRERSNTPLQSLTLLNDPVFFESAQALAREVCGAGRPDDRSRIDAIIQRALARPATSEESAALRRYLNAQRAMLDQQPAAAESIAPLEVAGVARRDLAAWTCLASVALNLHEFVTRD